MRNKLGFIGSILGTCFAGVSSIVFLAAFALLIDLMSALGESSLLALLIMIIEVAIMVLALIFNILSIVASNNIEKMNKKKGIIITAIIFDFIASVLLFYAIINEFSTLNLLCALGLIASAILLICGLSGLKKQIMKVEEEKRLLEAQNAQKVEEVKTETVEEPKAE